MAIPIQNGDRLIQWYRVRLGDNTTSLVFYFPRVVYTNAFFLATFVEQSRQRTNLNLEPILGAGEYQTGSHLYLVRNDTIVDDLDTNDTPLSIASRPGPLPPGVSPLSSFRPATPSPRKVAKKYWPFVRADFLASDASLTPAGQAAVAALATSYLFTQDWGGSGFSVRCRTGFDGTWPNPGSLWATQVTHTFFATQRRRNRGSQRSAWGTPAG